MPDILVVESEPGEPTRLHEAFRAAGFTVRVSTDLGTTLEDDPGYRPDIVLMAPSAGAHPEASSARMDHPLTRETPVMVLPQEAGLDRGSWIEHLSMGLSHALSGPGEPHTTAAKNLPPDVRSAYEILLVYVDELRPDAVPTELAASIRQLGTQMLHMAGQVYRMQTQLGGTPARASGDRFAGAVSAAVWKAAEESGRHGDLHLAIESIVWPEGGAMVIDRLASIVRYAFSQTKSGERVALALRRAADDPQAVVLFQGRGLTRAELRRLRAATRGDRPARDAVAVALMDLAALGARIDIDSGRSAGTRFVVRMPRRRHV